MIVYGHRCITHVSQRGPCSPTIDGSFRQHRAKIALRRSDQDVYEDAELDRKYFIPAFWALIIVAPLDGVKKLASATTQIHDRVAAIATLVENMPGLLKHFLPPSSERRKSRSTSATDKANDRDGCECVVTASGLPQQCHIWPLAARAELDRTCWYLMNISRFYRKPVIERY